MDEHDYLFGRSERQMDERREVKVRIPVAFLVRLHGLKLLNGQGISDTVVEALERYFANQESTRGAGGEDRTATGGSARDA